jgi:predicted Rdx family selenoprotein
VLRDAGHEASAIPGEKSQFDVRAGGELVFSKHEAGRFPEDYEIVRELAGRG